MLLSVIDELRANTISKVREIRVSPAFSASEHDEFSNPDTPLRLFKHVCSCLSVFSGCPGFQQRWSSVPAAWNGEQRGRDVLCWCHRAFYREEEKEEETWKSRSYNHMKQWQSWHFSTVITECIALCFYNSEETSC